MKVGKNNEILEATSAELRQIWKKNGWDEDYTFDKYFDIQVKHNHVKIVDTKNKKYYVPAVDEKPLNKKETEAFENFRKILPN